MINKSGQDWGSFAAVKGPLAVAKQCFIAARPSGKNGPASGLPRRSYCSQHEKCCVLVLFCYSVAPRTRLLD